MTINAHYPVMWNERTKRVEPVKVVVSVDMNRIAEHLARKAMKSKTGKASALFGAVKVAVVWS